MTVPEILRQAAVEVRKGWTRFTREDAQGRVCALGALDRASGASRSWVAFAEYLKPEAVDALAAALGVVLARVPWVGAPIPNADPIALWNNAPDQTAENVATTMEFAAVLAEQAAGAATRSAPQEEAPCLLTRA